MMTPQRIDCQTVLASARGRAVDAPELQRHLAECAPCRLALEEIRSIVETVQAGSEAPADAARSAALALARARAPEPLLGWGGRLALGTAALAAFLAVAVLGTDAPVPGERDAQALATATFSPGSVGDPRAGAALDLEVHAHGDDRLLFELRTAGGTEQGELDLSTHYVLDTVPVSAVVVDTF